MKKVIFIVFAVAVMGWAGHCQSEDSSLSRDCDAIVRPYIDLNYIDAETYPAEKLQYRCDFSKAAFYIVSEVPNGATVFDLSDLTNLVTGRKVPQDYPVDLNTFSYYAYNFMDFQRQDFKNTIYFRMGSRRDHRYLAVRSTTETSLRITYPEKFQD